MDKKVIIPLFVLIVSVLALGCVQGPKEGGTQAPAEQNVYIVNMAPPTMLEELKSGDIDAFIAWEPFPAEAAVDGYARYLINSSEIWPNHPCCILAASKSYTDDRVLTAIVWAHIKATQFINDPANHNKTVQYAMEFTGKNRRTAETALANIDFVEYPNTTEFENYYYRLKAGHLLKRSAESLGYANDRAFFNDFLDQSYYLKVKQKLEEDPSWVPPAVSSKEVVRIGHLSADLHEMAVYVALQEGYFRQVGLVNGENLFIKGNYVNGVAAMEAFKNHEIDVCYLGGAPSTLKRVNDDTKIRIIAGVNNVGSSIMVGVNSDIHTPKELAGKTIATPGVGTVQDFIVRQLAEEEGYKVVMK